MQCRSLCLSIVLSLHVTSDISAQQLAQEIDPATRRAYEELGFYYGWFIPHDSGYVDFKEKPGNAEHALPGFSASPLVFERIKKELPQGERIKVNDGGRVKSL